MDLSSLFLRSRDARVGHWDDRRRPRQRLGVNGAGAGTWGRRGGSGRRFGRITNMIFPEAEDGRRACSILSSGFTEEHH